MRNGLELTGPGTGETATHDASTRHVHGRPNLRAASYRGVERGAPVEDYGSQRQCADDGCTTLLSRYNPSPACSLHAGWQDTRQRSHG